MAEITIEGASPNSFIGVGQRITVTPTALIRNLIRRGFAVVVRDEPVPVPVPEPVVGVVKPKRNRRRKAAPVLHDFDDVVAEPVIDEADSENER